MPLLGCDPISGRDREGKRRGAERETRDKERKEERKKGRKRAREVPRVFRPVSAAGRAAIGRARARRDGDSVRLGTVRYGSSEYYALTSVRYGASRGAYRTRVF